MDHGRIERAAAYLVAQRQPGATLAMAFPEDVRPRDWGDVCAIQLAVAAQLGGIGGWKVGAHDATAEPTASPLPKPGIVGSPAAVSSRFRGAECEIGFTFGRALPPRDRLYGEADIVDALASCQATLEIISARFENHPGLDKLSLAADFGAHQGLCVGAPGTGWTPAMFAELEVTMAIDGVVHRTAVGSNPGGTDLLRLLVWLANADVVRSAGGIAAGAVVTTGSWTGLNFVSPGATVSARFAGFPLVEVEFL